MRAISAPSGHAYNARPTNNIFLKKGLHFPNIHARISNVNIKSIDRVVVFSAHAFRESRLGGSGSAWKTGLSPGSCRLKSAEIRVRRCDRRYRVEGVSAPDGVRRKANCGWYRGRLFRSFVPRNGDGRPFFRSLCPPLWGGWPQRGRVRCGKLLFF